MVPSNLERSKGTAASQRTELVKRKNHAWTIPDTTKGVRADYTEAKAGDADRDFNFAQEYRSFVESRRYDMINYKEIQEYLSPSETMVDLFMQGQASRATVQPIRQCRELATELSTSIFDAWGTLKFLAVYLEPIIHKRWRKMSLTHRREVLLEAWPGMSASHRPDVGRFMSLSFLHQQQNPLKCCFPEFLWPYINLEDLLCPSALLMFINSRAHSHPNIFAYSDLEKAPMEKLKKEFLALRKDNATMAFIGRESVQTYGEILHWQDDAAAKQSIKAGRTVHVDHGIQILWIQRGIYGFLLRCVHIVLKDIMEAIMSGTYPPPPPVPPQPLDMSKSSSKSQYIFAREAPYRTPSAIDWHHLQALVRAQKDQARDHLIALTDDPGYFTDLTEQYRSHRMELLLDVNGGLHPAAKDFPLLNKAQRQMASDAHYMLFAWQEVFTRIVKLRDMSLEHGPGISIEEDLPSEYFYALVEARFYLETISIEYIDVLKAQFSSSPALRKYHFRGNAGDPNLGVFQIMQHQHLDRDNEVLHRVLRLIRIFEDKGMRDLIGLHVVLDEFERLMQDEPRAKDLISPHLASSISQLSILSECLDQLHHFQPWAQKIERTIDENKWEYRIRYEKGIRHWGTINAKHENFRTQSLFEVGNPKDGKFDYPAEQARTRKSVEAMIRAEAALRAFWAAANAHWRLHVGTTPAALVSHIIGDREPHCTPPWVEPKVNGSRPKSALDNFVKPAPFFGHSHDVSKQITGNFNKLAVVGKDKKKTRGCATAKIDESAGPEIAGRDEAALRTTSIDKRAYKVFGSLFHSAESKDQPGQVTWLDFLHAMTKAGFSAEKLQGSAWHFTPQNKDLERSIQFHEPHPNNKLPLTWARRYGRRLTRAFGWTRETFTLA